MYASVQSFHLVILFISFRSAFTSNTYASLLSIDFCLCTAKAKIEKKIFRTETEKRKRKEIGIKRKKKAL